MRRLLALTIGALAVAAAGAPPPGASSCSGCHGGIAPLPPLAGQKTEDIQAALDAFRTDQRPGTVMNRLAKGLTKPESDAIAAWWAAQK